MDPKIKNKNKNKKWFVITLFFALLQISQASIALSASITAEEMASLTNKSRAEAGLRLLSVNEKLTEAAKEKADDMFEFQYFDHNSPNGLTPWDFIRSAGYDYIYAGENLAIDFISAKSAHQALMESSSHRENILNSNYTEIGIAAVEGIFEGNKSIIVVEEFGTPMNKAANADYDPNENIELALEEKVDEINSLNILTERRRTNVCSPSCNEEKEIELLSEKEEFSQTGLPAGQEGSTQEYGANEGQEYEVNGLEEESVIEQDDDLSLRSFNANFDIRNPAFRLFENGQDKILYYNYETLKGKFRGVERSDKRSDSGVCYESGTCNDEKKSSETFTEYNQILLAGSLNNEKVRGLVNKAYAKDEYIKMYNYEQGPLPAVNRYLRNEFILRIFLFYVAMAALLIFDFIITAYFYRGRDLNKTC